MKLNNSCSFVTKNSLNELSVTLIITITVEKVGYEILPIDRETNNRVLTKKALIPLNKETVLHHLNSKTASELPCGPAPYY